MAGRKGDWGDYFMSMQSVDVIMDKNNISFEDAVKLFYRSGTYKTLQNTENGLWAESAEYIADRFFEEEDM